MREPPPAREIFTASRNHLTRSMAGIQKLTGSNAYAVSAAGAVVRLNDGREVLDLGTWASSVLGHRPAPVIAAVREQCDTLPTAARGLANHRTPLLARRLVELASPSRLRRVWFGANGADVVEAALKLARLATGRLRVLAVAGGFHGRTLGALAVSDADRYHGDLAPLLREVTVVEPTAEAVERETRRGDVAAVILEIIPGGGRAVPRPAAMLERWVHAAHDSGAMVIVDEIQTGMWRCGTFALSRRFGLDPDAILFGKALGGGVMPLSALVGTPEMLGPLEESPFLHSQTFAGHPLACAAGLAAVETLPGAAAADADRVTDWLVSLRRRLSRHSEVIANVDAYGLMMSIEFRSPELAGHFVVAAGREGVLLSPSDGDRAVVRVLPPLVLENSQMAQAANALDRLCAGWDRWPTRFVNATGAAGR
jgi:putrescine aminotransferase